MDAEGLTVADLFDHSNNLTNVGLSNFLTFLDITDQPTTMLSRDR